jgi:excinuclease UvrABC ATPase subunit
VGTTIEIYDYLRVLFARVGTNIVINAAKKWITIVKASENNLS